MDFQEVIAKLRQTVAIAESVRLDRQVEPEEISIREIQEAIREGRATACGFFQDFCIVRYGQGANDSIRDNFLALFHKSVRCLGQPVLLVERELAVLGGLCQSRKPEAGEYELATNLSMGVLEDFFVCNAPENRCGFPVDGRSFLLDLSPDGRAQRKISGQAGGLLLSPLERDLGRDLGKPLPFEELGLLERLGEPLPMLEVLVGFSEIQDWKQKYPQFFCVIEQMCLFLGTMPETLAQKAKV